VGELAGQQFGNYRLLRSLGRGRFAEVYLGEHIHIKTQVAVKVPSTQLVATDLERLIQEVQTAASFEHPHIVRVFDFSFQEEIPFFVMNYAPNGTLRQRHPKESCISLDDVLSYVQQIALALQYAHDRKVIHRDVKPENMLLGSQGEILLSDFGIAVTTAGTAAYMAPEQIIGKPCVASDQYALGVIVYEWLTGSQPFHGSLFEVYAQHLQAPFPSLRKINPEVPPEVEQCIAKALSKDPEERFASIQDFATTLQEKLQQAITTPISIPTQRLFSKKVSDSNTRPDDLTILKTPSETLASPKIGPDDSTVLQRLTHRKLSILMAAPVIIFIAVIVLWSGLLPWSLPPKRIATGPTLAAISATTASRPGYLAPALPLHVSGNQIMDSNNQIVRLLGANRSGTEYKCIHAQGIFDGQSDQISINAMLTWHINALRIPLNEDCWLNINMGNSEYGGRNYQIAIERYTDLLIKSGITPIFDLHWSAPGTRQATSLEPMPDREHAITFWSEVARAYKGNGAVIFDLFNEPFPDNNRKTDQAWKCWRSGTGKDCPVGTAGLSYESAGMQELVNAVRGTGATNIIMLSGIQYGSTLDHWTDYKPSDPLNQTVASWHVYNYSQCQTSDCWKAEVLPVIRQYPMIAAEIGENDQQGSFILQVMNFLDAKKVNSSGYLAWAWNTGQSAFSLITDYTHGGPTSPYGSIYKDHLLWQRP
jgi:serine/threonine protein kinase